MVRNSTVYLYIACVLKNLIYYQLNVHSVSMCSVEHSCDYHVTETCSREDVIYMASKVSTFWTDQVNYHYVIDAIYSCTYYTTALQVNSYKVSLGTMTAASLIKRPILCLCAHWWQSSHAIPALVAPHPARTNHRNQPALSSTANLLGQTTVKCLLSHCHTNIPHRQMSK